LHPGADTITSPTMFESLAKRLRVTFDGLTRRGTLSEADLEAGLREVRMALLEADVALPVVKDFIAGLRVQLMGAEIIASVAPGQMVIKRVHEALVGLLSGDVAPDGRGISGLNLATTPPAVILICGLQGSGKTTTTGKLALYLREKQRKKVLVASLDIYRPAAQEQLARVAQSAEVAALPIIAGELPAAITTRALEAARRGGYDVLLLDTAGRLHIDAELMAELQTIKTLAKPIETLLVADALTGQDAVAIARQFHEAMGITGIILTRLDGDGRGGAALSMRAVTGQPIKFAGIGEKLHEFEPFDAVRMADRILDRGDIVALVERAAEAMDTQDAEAAIKKFQSGKFDLNDMLAQLRQIGKMGGLGSMLAMLPGAARMQEKIGDKMPGEKALKHQEAVILAMTAAERANPSLLNASRKRRIAKGSGRKVEEINRLLKQHQQMETVMKQMKKMGGKGMLNPLALGRMLKG
jgi:signal recognition particle subunit SRP54